MIGFIYIMSNSAYPGKLKIGQTSKDPEERRKDLASTGVLEDFVLEYRALSEDFESLEKEIHKSLADKRVRADREFFTITTPEAINKIREIAGDRIESDKVFYASPEELKTIEEAKRKDVLCPDLGDFFSVDVIEVLVKVGDIVNENDSIITLETDKATMEIPAPFAGKVTTLSIKVGDKIGQGELILTLITDYKNEKDKKTEKEAQDWYKEAQERAIKAEERETAKFFRRESIRKARKEKEAQKENRVGFRPGAENNSRCEEEEQARIQAKRKEEADEKWVDNAVKVIYWLFYGGVAVYLVREFFF